jgi:asparagine synthase (glutamine-hydrolysing)
MSAIAGVWTRGVEPAPQVACARLLAAQSIYGPHATDQWDGGEISLGRRLFRLLPEDRYDTQPLVGAGGRLVVVADLRLDNRADLEAELRIPADRARSLCDGAILLAAWEHWAEDSFDHLVGDFAFAVWDRAKSALTLARDPLSQRPLHYHRGADFFAFASMPKGLHALEQIPRAPDEVQALEFLALMPESGTRSFFARVERVEPGCFVTVTTAALRSSRHWRPKRRPIKLAGPEDYAEALRDQFEIAVRAQLRGADGKVGAHLSGGLDSSAVAATAARLLAPSHGKVFGFTAVPRAGYTGGAPPWFVADEGPLAESVAAQYPNIEHVLVRPTGRLQTGALDRDHFLYDRPLLNLCNFDWLHEINRQARERGITVMLTGAGGNMSLTYSGLDVLPEMIAQGRPAAWLSQARRMVSAGTLRWRGVLFNSLGPWIPGPLWNRLNRVRGGYVEDIGRLTALKPTAAPALRRTARLKAVGVDPYARPAADTFSWRVVNLNYSDNGNYNKGALGGWGVDLRDPTSDRRLVEFCLNVPTAQFIAGGVPRALARRALADRLPPAILKETRRGYQAADWHEAATAGRLELADWVERLSECSPAAMLLDIPRLRRLLEDWPEGGWEREVVMEPYRFALLRGLSAGHFLWKASGANR